MTDDALEKNIRYVFHDRDESIDKVDNGTFLMLGDLAVNAGIAGLFSQNSRVYRYSYLDSIENENRLFIETQMWDEIDNSEGIYSFCSFEGFSKKIFQTIINLDFILIR